MLSVARNALNDWETLNHDELSQRLGRTLDGREISRNHATHTFMALYKALQIASIVHAGFFADSQPDLEERISHNHPSQGANC